MSKPDSTHENLFSYGTVRALHASDTPVATYEMHIPEFVRSDLLAGLRTALVADTQILTTTPNTTLQNFLSPLSRQCMWELHSGIMLRLLENITGIRNLLPDTHCRHSCLLPLEQALVQDTVKNDIETGLDISLVLLLCLDHGDAIIRNCSFPSQTSRNLDNTENAKNVNNVLRLVYFTHQAANS
jgi:hypothetical protein